MTLASLTLTFAGLLGDLIGSFVGTMAALSAWAGVIWWCSRDGGR